MKELTGAIQYGLISQHIVKFTNNLELDTKIDSARNEKDNLLAILDDFINGKLSASKIESVVNIAKNLINEKAEWEIERKRLIEENSTLKEQLKILRSKQFGKSSEKTRKKIEELEQKIEENEIELELKSSKKGGEKEEKSVNKARRHKLPEELEREEVIIEAPSKC